MAKTYGPGVVALVAVVAVAVVVAGLHFGYYNPIFSQQWNKGYQAGSSAAPTTTITPCSLDFTQNSTAALGNISAQIAADGSISADPYAQNSFTLTIENSGDEDCQSVTILAYNPTTDDEGIPDDLEDADDYFEVYVYDGITYTPIYKESEYKAGYSLDLAEGASTTLTIYVRALKCAAGTFTDASSYTLKFWVYQPYSDYAEKITATLAT